MFLLPQDYDEQLLVFGNVRYHQYPTPRLKKTNWMILEKNKKDQKAITAIALP